VNRRRFFGVSLGVLAGLAYGLGPLFFKGYVLPAGVGVISMLAWRTIVAAVLSWLFVLAQPSMRRAIRTLDAGLILRLMITGGIYLLNAFVYYAAIERIDISLAALLLGIYPALVAVASIRLGYQLEGRLAWASLAIVLVGAALTVGGVSGSGDQLGLALGVAAPVTYALYILLAARLAGERPGQTAHMRSSDGGPAGVAAPVAGAVLVTGMMILAVGCAALSGSPLLPNTIPSAAWPGLIGIGIFPAAIGVQAFYACAARVGAAQASLITMLEPAFVVVLGMVFLADTFTVVQAVGAATIFGGVIIAQLSTPAGSPERETSEALTQ
jgi:drug/metabolite transporter (DMT)-like permease